MRSTLGLTILSLLLSAAGPALAQETSPIVTDRPGFVFSSLTVGRGAFQYELGLPSVFLDESEGTRVRSTSLGAVLRYGIGDGFELRLGAPLFTDVQTDFGPFRETDRGYGDLEVGVKWHLLDNAGARPSFALIPSVTLPTGETGFSAEDPVYQLSAVAEWTLASGWGVGAIAGFLNGPSAGVRYGQETFGLSVGRTLPSPAWTAYGEAAHVVTGLEGATDSSFLGAGVKYLVSNNFQLDLSFDRGLTDDSPDWLFGLGFSARF